MGYLNPNEQSIEIFDYYQQPIEKDAWSFTLKALKKFATKTKCEDINNYYYTIKLHLLMQRKLAKHAYGRNFAQIIDNKIKSAYHKNAQNSSYDHVMEILSREGLKSEKAFSDYLVPIRTIEMQQSSKVNKEKETDKTKEEKMVEEFTKATEKKQQALAKKYGVAPEVVDKLINKVETPTSPDKPPQEPEKHKENTQKVTTKKGAEKIQVTIEKSKG